MPVRAILCLYVALLATPPAPRTDPFTGMAFVLVPAGSFEMGTPADEPQREPQEVLHRVTIPRPFFLAAREMTQDEWHTVTGGWPSAHAGCGSCPVERVTYVDIERMLTRLNAASAWKGFRLPTEAEWEYACRAGGAAAYGASATIDRAHANYDGTATAPAGSFAPNAWGLFDMPGNVWEWTSDDYAPYPGGAAPDRAGYTPDRKVIRGGSWRFGADSARCGLRYTHRPQDRGDSLGVRLAHDAEPPASRVSIDVGITIERLVSEYRFENDSAFDAAGTVPHFFVQHYESTQPWLVGRARYRAGTRSAETTVGYAPPRTAFASDVDTFFQPSGDVVTSGTAGDVRLQGFSVDQRLALTRAGSWAFGVGGRYTRRAAEFLPADRVVTHTQPPSITREFITTREFTTSHEIRIGATVESVRAIGGAWRMTIAGAGWPVVRGRLVTELPDKYPGQDIVFEAVAFGGEGRVAFARRVGPASLALTAEAGGLLPYAHSASLTQHTAAVAASLVFDVRR